VTFEDYIQRLAQHEADKSEPLLRDPRQVILIHAGIRLNSLADFLTDPLIEWSLAQVPVDQITFTSTLPEWNEIFLRRCLRSPERLARLLKQDALVRSKVAEWASYSDEPLLLKTTADGLRVLDGMHRFVGAIVQQKTSVSAFVQVGTTRSLPLCEAHTLYDLIRGFLNSARDMSGRADLLASLRLMCRSYRNAASLLRERFDPAHLPDPEVQEVIGEVLFRHGSSENPRTPTL